MANNRDTHVFQVEGSKGQACGRHPLGLGFLTVTEGEKG